MQALSPRGLLLALRLARRELRGGLRGFRVFLGCLTLGVATIAAVASLSDAIKLGLRENGQVLLGGDVELRLTHQEASPAQLAWLRDQGRISETTRMRAMARPAAGDGRVLVELKAVDDAYPLFGAMTLDPPLALDAALAKQDGTWGAVADANLLQRLGLQVGDRIRLGEATYVLRATIAHEPDRTVSVFTLGPRLMVAAPSLAATGLLQPGSLVRYYYHLALPAGTRATAWRQTLDARFPDAGWRIRDLRNPAPGLRSFVDRMTLFLTLVGLSALLVGGVGVSNAVRSYLDGKAAVIATLKCLGAPGGLVFWIYLLQVLAIAGGGIAVGLLVGAALPLLAGALAGDRLPVPVAFGIYPWALVEAAAFGGVSAVAFCLWPLGRAQQVPAAGLFRDLVAPASAWPRWPVVAGTVLLFGLLAGLAVYAADDKRFAWWFVFGALGAFVAFRLAAWAVMHGAARLPRSRHAGLRLAVANLHRPGAPTASVVLSLGLGVTVLVAIGLIEGNVSRQISETIPERAPGLFFIDIQPQQVAGFDAAVHSVPGVTRLDRVPMLRGRLVKVNGVPADQLHPAPDAAWVLRGDRGLTWTATPPTNGEIVAGKWWPADYRGPPLVSMAAEIARGFGIGVGDTITVNVLGREVEARIANLRDVDWRSLGINFVLVFSPGTLEGAPQTYIATAYSPPAAEAEIERAVTDRFPNVSAIRVKDALETANRMLGQIGSAIRGIGSITLLAGTLVLAGALAAGHRRRVYDAVVLKVLGATRRQVLGAFLIEYGVLGTVTGLIAAGVGSVVAWAVVTEIMHATWVFLPGTLVTTTVLATLITLLAGFADTWWALGRKAAPLLRNA